MLQYLPKKPEISLHVSSASQGHELKFPLTRSPDAWGKASLKAFYAVSSYAHNNNLQPLPASEQVSWMDWRVMNDPNGLSFHGYRGDRNFMPEGLYRQVKGIQYEIAEGQAEPRQSNTTFVLDDTIPMKGNVVPYNSTLWMNNTAISIKAPFLNLKGNCTYYYNTLELCECYNGVLLEKEWQTLENLICISKDGFIWGFSSTITFVGAVLEGLWILGCLAMWINTSKHSQLVKLNRTGAGTIRNVMDAAGGIAHVLGDTAGGYTEKELRKALQNCPPVGYVIEERNGVENIAVAPIPDGLRGRKKLQLGFQKYYG
jgi:hypothetical protein